MKRLSSYISLQLFKTVPNLNSFFRFPYILHIRGQTNLTFFFYKNLFIFVLTRFRLAGYINLRRYSISFLNLPSLALRCNLVYPFILLFLTLQSFLLHNLWQRNLAAWFKHAFILLEKNYQMLFCPIIVSNHNSFRFNINVLIKIFDKLLFNFVLNYFIIFNILRSIFSRFP